MTTNHSFSLNLKMCQSGITFQTSGKEFHTLINVLDFCFCKQFETVIFYSGNGPMPSSLIRSHLMPVVLQQAQTEAVFISHTVADPLACWDAGLVAQPAATHQQLVTTCLSGDSACLPVCPLLICLCLSSFLFSTVQTHFLPVYLGSLQALETFFFLLLCFPYTPPSLPVSPAVVTDRLSVLPPLWPPFCQSICTAACLAVWLPSRGMSGQVLDNKHPADTREALTPSIYTVPLFLTQEEGGGGHERLKER